LQQAVYPVFIELFKHVVEQEQGREMFFFLQYFHFCQFEGKEQAFALTL
jgi:hypothetical protein